MVQGLEMTRPRAQSRCAVLEMLAESATAEWSGRSALERPGFQAQYGTVRNVDPVLSPRRGGVAP